MDVNRTALPDISLRGLTKRYGDVAAVDGVDLDVAQGEFFTMLGPSGSGKTTTLRLIAGFELPDAGTIELRGQRRQRAPALRARRQHGLPGLRAVPAHDGAARTSSTGCEIEEGAEERAPPPRRRGARARAAPGYGDRKPAQLSGGQRQRVALARAIVNRPRVLLLDEPLGALDLKLRQEMQVELKRIQREVGITFVYVTHDQEEALTMSDRIAVFNEGRIEQVGAPAEVYEHPANDVRRGLRRRLERARARRQALHDPAGEGPRARSRRGRRRPPRRGGQGPRRQLRGDDHALPAWSSTRAASCRSYGRTSRRRRRRRSRNRDARFRIGWREEHTFAIKEKEEGMKRSPWTRGLAIAAVLSLGVVACGGDDERATVVEQRGQGARGRRRRSTSSARARARST